ncbi:sodium:solute symporter [Pandoraea terrae]|uniref:Sodium:solute symporter n=1 Tax=Pandoraea terrae TaxID=1537710 RepID=A0A5E4TRZ3_9BURK|nr:sodium:solute symporter [Pandoraea terrae]VVD90710.1 sodium:solute symporter [Pandoraea terrae]
MNAALIVIFGFLAFALFIGIRARAGRTMSLEQWAVGGRGFGTLLVFLLMAGEAFSTFTFLGASGWAYSKGPPAFYILAYGSLAYVMGYWVLPAVWRHATKHRCVSFSDFFATAYQSRALGVVVSIVAVLGMSSLLIIQLRGLGIIVSEASYGSIPPAVAIWLGAAAMVAYIVISGIHGSASIAIFKDILILGIAIFLGVYLPLHYYGGFGPMFNQIEAANPGFLKMPETGLNLSWYNSTILLTSLGYYLYPYVFTSVYAAKNDMAVRKNAILMPLYQVVIAFMFFVGFAAILQVPGLKGAESDLALLKLIKLTFDPWFVGVIGGTGVLTALVPGSMIMLNASTLIAKNVYRDGFAPHASERRVAQVAKGVLPVFGLVAVYFVLRGGATFVSLAIFASSLLTQLFPSFIASLLPGVSGRKFGTKHGAFAGIAAGAAVLAMALVFDVNLATLLPNASSAVKSLNMGLVALAANAVAFVVVSAITRASGVSAGDTSRAALES